MSCVKDDSIQLLGEPKSTDYCFHCGQTPKAGIHTTSVGHVYVDPRIPPLVRLETYANLANSGGMQPELGRKREQAWLALKPHLTVTELSNDAGFGSAMLRQYWVNRVRQRLLGQQLTEGSDKVADPAKAVIADARLATIDRIKTALDLDMFCDSDEILDEIQRLKAMERVQSREAALTDPATPITVCPKCGNLSWQHVSGICTGDLPHEAWSTLQEAHLDTCLMAHKGLARPHAFCHRFADWEANNESSTTDPRRLFQIQQNEHDRFLHRLYAMSLPSAGPPLAPPMPPAPARLSGEFAAQVQHVMDRAQQATAALSQQKFITMSDYVLAGKAVLTTLEKGYKELLQVYAEGGAPQDPVLVDALMTVLLTFHALSAPLLYKISADRDALTKDVADLVQTLSVVRKELSVQRKDYNDTRDQVFHLQQELKKLKGQVKAPTKPRPKKAKLDLSEK